MRRETLFAPTTGIVNQIYTSGGEQVNIGMLILEIEVMKLLVPLTAGLAGEIKLTCAMGDLVEEGQILAEITGI